MNGLLHMAHWYSRHSGSTPLSIQPQAALVNTVASTSNCPPKLWPNNAPRNASVSRATLSRTLHTNFRGSVWKAQTSAGPCLREPHKAQACVSTQAEPAGHLRFELKCRQRDDWWGGQHSVGWFRKGSSQVMLEEDGSWAVADGRERMIVAQNGPIVGNVFEIPRGVMSTSVGVCTSSKELSSKNARSTERRLSKSTMRGMVDPDLGMQRASKYPNSNPFGS